MDEGTKSEMWQAPSAEKMRRIYARIAELEATCSSLELRDLHGTEEAASELQAERQRRYNAVAILTAERDEARSRLSNEIANASALQQRLDGMVPPDVRIAELEAAVMRWKGVAEGKIADGDRDYALAIEERDAAIVDAFGLSGKLGRLRAVLEKYGGHAIACRDDDPSVLVSECDCGYAAALADCGSPWESQ